MGRVKSMIKPRTMNKSQKILRSMVNRNSPLANSVVPLKRGFVSPKPFPALTLQRDARRRAVPGYYHLPLSGLVCESTRAAGTGKSACAT